MQNLERLAERCLVRLDSGDGFGSGVRVAPNFVLTCAHVASAGDVTVSWSSSSCSGRVVDAVPGQSDPAGGLWPLPDIALVEIPSAMDQPCAWLSDEDISTGTPLYALGMSEVWSNEPKPDSALGHCGGRASLARRFVGDAIAEGMSGGPVVDLESWAVCGLIKASRSPGTDMGGMVTPLSAIRELTDPAWREMWRQHDIYHGGRSPWPALRHQLGKVPVGHATRALDALDTARLLGILATIVDSDEPAARYLSAMGRAARTDVAPLVDLRDVALALIETMSASGDLHPLLRFTADLGASTGSAGVELRDWTEQIAWRRGEQNALITRQATVPPQPDVQPMITVQITPGAQDPGRYMIAVRVDGDAGQPVPVYCDDNAAHTRDDLPGALAQPIMTALKLLHGNAIVAFLIPTELYDLDFENLPVGRRSRLGRMAPVVLCDLERLTSEETWHDWHTRWSHLQAGTAVTQSLACRGEADPDRFDGSIRDHPRVATILLSKPPVGPDWDLLDVALYAGVPAAVWPRDACEGHGQTDDEAPCSGEEFLRRFLELRSQQQALTLPYLVKQLRLSSAKDSPQVALLWDDPTRTTIPAADLVEPFSPT